MAITQVGIIYSTNLRTIRRIVIPTTDQGLFDTKINGQGESIYRMPLATYNAAGGLAGLQAALSGVIGPAGNDLCAVCNGQDQVMGVVRADPAITSDGSILANGWYFVLGIPNLVQTGTQLDLNGASVPTYQAITRGWFYNPANGHFGLTKNPA